MLLLLVGAVMISERAGQCRSLALCLGSCWNQIVFLAPQPVSYNGKWHGNCLWYFYFSYYIERQNMRKKGWLLFLTASSHQLLTPCAPTMVCNRLRHTVVPAVRWSPHPHCATDLLMTLPVNKSGSFFPCLHSEWCGVQRVKFRTDRQHAPHGKRVEK